MEVTLTRRDAMEALAALGVAGAGGGLTLWLTDENREPTEDGPLSGHDRATLAAAAEVLYPDDVTGVDEFVQQYVDGRATADEHAEGLTGTLAYLDEYCESWFGERFADLEPAERDEALRRMHADEAHPDPDGSDVERLRYYVINDLLFALYASPTGGRLIGIDNPPGHPGGLSSYQRGGEP
ncbi:MAG: gluconate 2-dehydrogenase subunit 3 family protein [Halorhabdus sp.]